MTAVMTIEQLFFDHFNEQPSATSMACGRVNLIGEHIDYNGGVVLPTPINRYVHVAISHGAQDTDEICSQMFDGCTIRPINSTANGDWSDYVAGALSFARNRGFLQHGVRIAIESDIPYGAGVSSSAAVIIATFRAVESLTNATYDNLDVAKWAQQVENEYIGMPCGIMDQMAVAIAEPGHALSLDTDSLDCDHVTLPSDYHFAVLFSGVTRRLDEGRYAIRREECESAAEKLAVPYLCTMPEQKGSYIGELPEPLNRRAQHVFSEHQRVLKAIDALKQSDIEQFGQLMNESHVSMRDDFEITTDEVDAVVESAREFGAIGARMTGGGFGGCIVACVPNSQLEIWKENMLARHHKARYIA